MLRYDLWIEEWRNRIVGLVVLANMVTVDHAVKDLLVTTVKGNPKISTIACGLQVISIFTRLKASAKVRRSRDNVGDNCHMLYALKQKNGLVTNLSSIRLLVESGRQILNTFAGQTGADTVVYMPSGYSLSKIMGKRCAQAFGAQLIEDVFRKTTKQEAYAMLTIAKKNGGVSSDEQRRLDYRLKKSVGFSLKDIPMSFRHFFNPLHLNPTFQGIVRGRVLLVDDLFASGRTLGAAAALIRSMPGVTAVNAVCIFSDV